MRAADLGEHIVTDDPTTVLDSGEPANVITPRQLAIALIEHEVADVRNRITEHIRERNHDDTYNSQIRVFLERTAELLRDAAQLLQDHLNDDD